MTAYGEESFRNKSANTDEEKNHVQRLQSIIIDLKYILYLIIVMQVMHFKQFLRPRKIYMFVHKLFLF